MRADAKDRRGVSFRCMFLIDANDKDPDKLLSAALSSAANASPCVQNEVLLQTSIFARLYLQEICSYCVFLCLPSSSSGASVCVIWTVDLEGEESEDLF